MAQTLEELLVLINAGTSELRKELNKGRADVGKFEKDVNRQIGKVDKRFASLGSSLRRSIGALGLAFGAREVVQGFGNFADRMREVDRQAESLGSTTDAIQELTRTFQEFNLDDNDVSDALGTLADRAQDAKDGMQSFIDDFALLGIEVDDLRNKRPEELFALMADGVASIEDPTRRTAGIVRIFGDDLGRRLNPLMQEGSRGLEAYAARWHDAGLIIDKDGVEAGRRAADTFAEVGRNVSSLSDNLLLELLPAINAVAIGWNAILFNASPFPFQKQINDAEEELGELRQQLQNMQQLGFGGPQIARVLQEIADTEKKIEDLKRKQNPPTPIDPSRRNRFPITDIPGPDPARNLMPTVRVTGASDATPPVTLEEVRRVNDALAQLEQDALRSQGRMAEAIRMAAQAQIDEWERVADETPAFAAKAALAIEAINTTLAEDLEALGDNSALKDLADSIGFTLQGAFSNAFMGVETDFDSLLQRMAADFAASQLLDMLATIGAEIGGPVGAFLGAVGQGSGRAAGGRVDPFHAFPVGEMGRTEMFVPDVPGRILNAAQLAGMSRGGGGMTVNQEFNITTSIPAELEAAIRNVGGAAGRAEAVAVLQAQRGRI